MWVFLKVKTEIHVLVWFRTNGKLSLTIKENAFCNLNVQIFSRPSSEHKFLFNNDNHVQWLHLNLHTHARLFEILNQCMFMTIFVVIDEITEKLLDAACPECKSSQHLKKYKQFKRASYGKIRTVSWKLEEMD